jgi:hypothetical protein
VTSDQDTTGEDAAADLEAALARACVGGRRHGRAAVYWQIGDSGAADALRNGT